MVETACELTGARYGALGVIGSDGLLEKFIHTGMAPDQVDEIGDLPRGKGLLGALIHNPEPIRLARLADDPRSSGFPPHHPPMDSFLGVPIKLRNEVYGNLYLTDSLAGEFTADDTDLALSLAGTAAVAIENARLFSEAQRKQDWLQASTEITRLLLTGGSSDALREIADRVKVLARADVVTVELPASRSGYFRVEVATGVSEEVLQGHEYPAPGTLSQAVVDTGQASRIANAADCSDLVNLTQVVPLGPVMALPLASVTSPRGTLVAARLPGRPVFSLAELDMATTFAGQVSIALGLADAQVAKDQLTLLEDRGRIARDLHDHVIQRLFATGLTVQSVLPLTASPATEKLSAVVDELDAAIRQIRASIFSLEGALNHSESVRSELLDTIVVASSSMPVPPQVRLVGPIDTLISPALRDDVQAVLRESLTNVVRHARAATVTVVVSVADGVLAVDVQDDGVGFGSPVHRSGLANLLDRAENHRGTFVVESAPTKGTRLQWSVPIP
ncbi:GAF domain-containing protein [Nakamurella antarctica]|uniref:GAF domain-containing protein n=1 Tax=Nakamurella antarctica TaxID=1902245 RepID=A0A3G8ZMZ6_9ACTN|nr:GAF domain-containing protein [Nakamurella antarctica]